MSYETTLFSGPGYLEVVVRGERNLRDSKSLLSQIANVCRLRDLHRAVVVEWLTGRMSTMDVFDLSGHLDSIKWPRDTHLALVDADPASLGDNEFGALAARNRGYMVEAFSNEDSAFHWLGVKPSVR